MLVLKYTIVPGANNDQVSLYIFDGSFPTTEPTVPDIGPLSNVAAADIEPGSIAFRKFNTAQDLVVDGIRIGTSWSDVVPVELNSFTASISGNNVLLNWITATEINNSGFEVLRSNRDNNWQKIGFVQGNGTTSEIHNYSFSDRNLSNGNYSYKLKQIDFDGTYKYSNVVNADVTNPVEFNLSQNYPNPFNPSTVITYTIPQAGMVTLKVYNTLGEEIAVLVNGMVEPGIHNVNFDASGLNSGMYFYRLESGNFVQVKKMTLLK